ncbi:hypothetical protein DSECCO2_627950 [anaerobic digester metagenome]
MLYHPVNKGIRVSTVVPEAVIDFRQLEVHILEESFRTESIRQGNSKISVVNINPVFKSEAVSVPEPYQGGSAHNPFVPYRTYGLYTIFFCKINIACTCKCFYPHKTSHYLIMEFKTSPPAGPKFRKQAAIFLKNLSYFQDFFSIGFKYGFQCCGFWCSRIFRAAVPFFLYSCEIEFGNRSHKDNFPQDRAVPGAFYAHVQIVFPGKADFYLFWLEPEIFEVFKVHRLQKRTFFAKPAVFFFCQS